MCDATHHNALHDAESQAKHLMNILKALEPVELAHAA